MNTYFNEITSKPAKTADGNVVYKIPAGAFCSNGDMGAVFDDDENGLIIHISKCDFWKFTKGAHKSGGIKTVGSLRISNVDLSEYNIKQYFDKGLLECKFGNAEIEFFIAPENIMYVQIKSSVKSEAPVVSVELPDTCDSKNSEISDKGTKCYIRRFEGGDVVRNTGVALGLREIESAVSEGEDTE